MRLLKVPHSEMLGGREELERSLPDFQPIVRHRAPRGRGPRRFPALESGQRDDWNGCWVDVGVLENA